ncbi:hypothetical protein [Streptomyces capoamus]|uniref:hypothetical protein n=1 Tax=Streptomyces capoamus TaxID=68183 RepID=UPI00339ACEFF
MAKVTVHGGPSDEHAKTGDDAPVGTEESVPVEEPSEEPRPARARMTGARSKKARTE